MFLRQISDPCLAQFAYLIGCQQTGEAIIIDPQRDLDRYHAIAAVEELTIVAAAETHIHADYLSGAREFATDPAKRVYVSTEGGPDWQFQWAAALPNTTLLKDGDTFRIGKVALRAVHTPGHTPEHLVFLVTDLGGEAHEPMALLSGDCLFVGAAGRPDLLEQVVGVAGAQEQGARALYHSLRKLGALPEYFQVLPAHGAGSACGKALGAIPSSTIGYEKRFNSTLKLALGSDEESFVEFILRDQPEPPACFADLKRLNQVGPPLLGLLGPLPSPPPVTLDEVLSRLDEPAFVILDTRDHAAFFTGHLRRSLFTPPAKFTDFAGSFLTPENEIVLVVEEHEDPLSFVRQLIRLGFDRILGVLPADALASAPLAAKTSIPTATFPEVPALLAARPRSLLDVRRAAEFSSGHLRGAQNLAHSRLRLRAPEIPADAPLVVSCQSGIRAAGACAFLARTGREVICIADVFDHAPPELLV